MKKECERGTFRPQMPLQQQQQPPPQQQQQPPPKSSFTPTPNSDNLVVRWDKNDGNISTSIANWIPPDDSPPSASARPTKKLSRGILRKAESRFSKEPWTITTVHTNGTIRVQCGSKSERINIRRVKPFSEELLI